MSSVEDVSHQASGHKANLSNPNTSEESKQHSREVLKSLGGEDAFYGEDKQGDEAPAAGLGNNGNVIGGHKATISNPNTSQEAKDHSKQVLEQMGNEGKATGQQQ